MLVINLITYLGPGYLYVLILQIFFEMSLYGSGTFFNQLVDFFLIKAFYKLNDLIRTSNTTKISFPRLFLY